MEAIAFHDAEAAAREALWWIYEEALPASERKTRDALAAIGDDPEYSFTLFCADGAVAGFSILFLPIDAQFAVLEYLAVDAGRRSRGMGASIMQAVIDQTGDRTLLIEIDRDGSEQAMRRRRFYERSGCMVLDGVRYRMPRIGAEAPPEMALLARLADDHATLSRDTLRDWIAVIDTRMYAQARDDRRIAAMLDKAPAMWRRADG
ncbi:GNAT family N-acetyltransferase [Sphingomonas baiyangensis]|uniref:GNAT family N-acetyltransferase n=1 Tax=Sphingomonas baiyangensis TaxID=2572576 RepID=A0A4U1L789_9SPHN|nr:GNAT family N-acetyltransferase [Sphingomonas baiyangensis]TKD52817.1 GNAT family N-acetyltransferase [Sphingomonas baiyangensis]